MLLRVTRTMSMTTDSKIIAPAAAKQARAMLSSKGGTSETRPAAMSRNPESAVSTPHLSKLRLDETLLFKIYLLYSWLLEIGGLCQFVRKPVTLCRRWPAARDPHRSCWWFHRAPATSAGDRGRTRAADVVSGYRTRPTHVANGALMAAHHFGPCPFTAVTNPAGRTYRLKAAWISAAVMLMYRFAAMASASSGLPCKDRLRMLLAIAPKLT